MKYGDTKPGDLFFMNHSQKIEYITVENSSERYAEYSFRHQEIKNYLISVKSLDVGADYRVYRNGKKIFPRET